MTVQAIRNGFTVEVYEAHARIALDAGDHEEFNQCKSQLAQLYVSGLKSNNRAEITAYELIYYLLTKSMIDMGVALDGIIKDEELMADKKVQLALAFRKAWSSKNFSRFFKLYDQADAGMRALLDKFTSTQRKQAMEIMLKTYKPNIPIIFLQQQLGFRDDLLACKEYLVSLGIRADKQGMVSSNSVIRESS